MTKYKISIDELVEGERYSSNKVYEQTIDGDASFVHAVVKTVLVYQSPKPVTLYRGKPIKPGQVIEETK